MAGEQPEQEHRTDEQIDGEVIMCSLYQSTRYRYHGLDRGNYYGAGNR